MLIGSYRHMLDQKNRFRIPSKFKNGLGEGIVITKGSSSCLFVFSKEEFDKLLDKTSNISIFDDDAQKPLRLVMSSAFEAEEDGQGRLLLPSELKLHANIKKNIVLVGVGRRLEIWAEEVWDEYSKNQNFDESVKALKDRGV